MIANAERKDWRDADPCDAMNISHYLESFAEESKFEGLRSNSQSSWGKRQLRYRAMLESISSTVIDDFVRTILDFGIWKFGFRNLKFRKSGFRNVKILKSAFPNLEYSKSGCRNLKFRMSEFGNPDFGIWKFSKTIEMHFKNSYYFLILNAFYFEKCSENSGKNCKSENTQKHQF